MPYTDSLLASGERTIRRARRHPLTIVMGARWAILALALALAGLFLKLVIDGTGPIFLFLGWVTLGLFTFGAARLLWGLLRYWNEEYLVTSRRVIHVEGVVNKRATDASLEKINDAILTESAAGRVLGFGDLTVLLASEGGIERMGMLSDAKGFKRAMLEAKHDFELEVSRTVSPPIRSTEGATPAGSGTPDGSAGSARGSVGPSAAEVTRTLEGLRALRDRGAITTAEYEAKKAVLLARL
jgi:hypothetical protein